MEENEQPLMVETTPLSLDSIEEKTYTSKASVKVNDYYKQTDLVGISIRDICKIKEVASKTNVCFEILKEFALGIAMAFLGGIIGKFISGMNWNVLGDVYYFFISIVGFLVSALVYVLFCTKKYYDKNRLVDALNEHLFIPTGTEETDKNEK